MTFGKGIFIAVGANDAIVTSPADIVWTQRPIKKSEGELLHFRSVAVGADKVIALLPRGYMTSDNGVIWNTDQNLPRTFDSPGFIEDARAIAYGEGTFVVAGFQGGPSGLVSSDGQTWRSGGPAGGTDFVFVSEAELPGNTRFFSVTGTDSGRADAFTSIAFGAQMLIAVGVSFVSEASPIQTWLPDKPVARRPSACNRKLYGVAYGNGTFVAVGENGTILQSTPNPIP